MNVQPTNIPGVYTIDIQPSADDRGMFARTWDVDLAKENNLIERFDYSCISGNTAKHTLRGMHYQEEPHAETKLVRCTQGAIFDVALDLRPDSKTFKQWFGVELTAQNHKALYIPVGVAHGFLTLQEDTEVFYQIAGSFVAEASNGVRFDDPAFNISWPAKPVVISERDKNYPDIQL